MFPLTTVEIQGQGSGINDSWKLIEKQNCVTHGKKKKKKKSNESREDPFWKIHKSQHFYVREAFLWQHSKEQLKIVSPYQTSALKSIQAD